MPQILTFCEVYLVKFRSHFYNGNLKYLKRQFLCVVNFYEIKHSEEKKL